MKLMTTATATKTYNLINTNLKIGDIVCVCSNLHNHSKLTYSGTDTIPVSNKGRRAVQGELDNYSNSAYSSFVEALGVGVVESLTTTGHSVVRLLPASDARLLSWLQVRHYQPSSSLGLAEINLCWPWFLCPSEQADALSKMTSEERAQVGA